MKKILVILAGGVTLAMVVPLREVALFRESVNRGLVFTYEDTAVHGTHVMAYRVEDPDEVEADKPENDCNT